ncbi:hypothetical protein EHI44_17470 [Rhizobium leguminosarum]|nr:hypothetical protein EHI44_17470 [Rhizobium leguminosarum]
MTLLILDEPTNHLDIDSISAVEAGRLCSPPRLASSTASAPASYFEAPAGHLRMRLPWAPWRPCLILPAMVFQHCKSIEKGGSRHAILFSV